MFYEADGEDKNPCVFYDTVAIDGKNHLRPAEIDWRSSMFMPRWASRLTLIVEDVRVERLQDISETDALAEGVQRDSDGWRDYQMPQTQCCATAKASYQTLWDEINGDGAWAANPWVAAYTFRVIKATSTAEATHAPAQ